MQDIVSELGLRLRDLFPPDAQPGAAGGQQFIEATYDYTDEARRLLYQKVRLHPKDFRLRRPAGANQWKWSIKGVRRVLYRLPELLDAVRDGRRVWVVEGEKDVDRLSELGFVATCNVGGAGKWSDDDAQHFAGADVAVIPDNDDPGRDHAQQVARSLLGVAASVRIVNLPGLPEKGDVSDWLDGGGTAEELGSMAASSAEFNAPSDVRGGEPHQLYPPLDWEALWEGRADEVDWIVDGLLEAGRAAAVFAPAKSGKSFVMQELAACVASGQAFAALPVPTPRKVLYLDWENSQGDVLSRLKALGFAYQDLERLVYLSLQPIPPLDTEKGGRELAALAEHHAAELVILDTYARATEGPENEADTVRAYYRHTGHRLKAAGVACVRIDHAGKDLNRGARGSSAKADDVDTIWRLTGGHGRLTLELERSRTNHGLEEVPMVRREDGRLHPAAGRTRVVQAVPSVRRRGSPDEVERVVRALDDLGVPDEYGRDKAREALRQAGVPANTNVLAAAVRHRKNRDLEPDLAAVSEEVTEDRSSGQAGPDLDAVP